MPMSYGPSCHTLVYSKALKYKHIEHVTYVHECAKGALLNTYLPHGVLVTSVCLPSKRFGAKCRHSANLANLAPGSFFHSSIPMYERLR